MTKHFSRKEFILKTVTGIAGVGLLSQVPEAAERPEVHFRKLGKSGIDVTPLCFGAPRTNEESLIKYALQKGINFIDTGRSYGNGNNEKLVGKSVTSIRKDVIIQSKIRLDDSELPSRGKGKKGAEEIRLALSSKLEASLKALNTSYIDIMLYHDAADENLLFHSETMKYFGDMKRSGIIRACGFSTHNDYMNLILRNNSEGFYDVVMVPFNHKGAFTHSVSGNYSEWDQARLIELLSFAGEKGHGVIAMKTCSGGPFQPNSDTKPSFIEAVKWVLNHKFISSAAIAMASFGQVDEHLPLLIN